MLKLGVVANCERLFVLIILSDLYKINLNNYMILKTRENFPVTVELKQKIERVANIKKHNPNIYKIYFSDGFEVEGEFKKRELKKYENEGSEIVKLDNNDVIKGIKESLHSLIDEL